MIHSAGNGTDAREESSWGASEGYTVGGRMSSDQIRYIRRSDPEAPYLRNSMCPECHHPVYEHFDGHGTMYTCPRGNRGCGARYWVDNEEGL